MGNSILFLFFVILITLGTKALSEKTSLDKKKKYYKLYVISLLPYASFYLIMLIGSILDYISNDNASAIWIIVCIFFAVFFLLPLIIIAKAMRIDIKNYTDNDKKD